MSGKLSALVVPDYLEPIVGWRIWELYPDGQLESWGKFISARRDHNWPPKRVKRATNAFSDQEYVVSLTKTGCGFHAFKTREDLMHEFPYCTNYVMGYVHGEVYLWGTMVELERGYRAEFAYPKKLYAHNISHCRRLESLYGVPCEPTSHIDRVLLSWWKRITKWTNTKPSELPSKA